MATENRPWPPVSHPAPQFADYRLTSCLILLILAGCAGFTACILYTATAHEALALAANFPPHWPSPQLAPSGFAQLRGLLAGLAAGLGLLGVVLAPRARLSTRPGACWRAGGWWALPPHQQRWALASLLLLSGLRVVASLVGINVDDIASYEYFVRKSLFTVIAYYPAPNNHLLSNVVSWFFYQLYPGYWWSMRLPVLLLSTVGTVGWFLGLLHRTNYRVALLTSILFGFLETSLFAAALGRGYTLVVVCSGLGFFSMLRLGRLAAGGRAWAGAGLVAAGVLGLYAVPTFAYFLVGAYGWLGARWCRRPAYLLAVGGLGGATLLGASLLYLPLVFVSGLSSLLGNEFVTPLPAAVFWRQLPAYGWQLEGILMGESKNGVLASWHLGSWAAVLVLGGFVLLVLAARRGRLPGRMATHLLHTGLPALWLLLLPYLLLAAQRVQAPERTLGFKAVFLFLLASLEIDWLLATLGRRLPRLRTSLLAGVGLWVAVEVAQLYRSNELRLSYHRNPHLAAQWLLHQPPGPILAVGSPWYTPFLRFYLHFEAPTTPLLVDDQPQAGVRYRYLVGSAGTLAAPGAGYRQHRIPPDLNCEAIDILSY